MKKQYRSLFWLGASAGALFALRAVSKRINAYSFQGKVVVITGGSRGLGLAIARILAEQGARLAICARTEHQLKTAEEELTALGAEVLAVPCDLTNRQQAEAFMQKVKTHYGQVDVLINNAGIIQAGPLEAMTVQDFENAMNTHFWAPLFTMLSVIPEMKVRGEGRIVNIASVGGKVSVPHIVPYSASKFALVGLSTGFRHELKKDGIKIITINPGLTRSGSNVNISVKGQAEKEYAWFTAMGNSLLTSSSVENTARQIVEACRYGEAEVLTNLPARVLALANDIFPELTSDILSLSSQYILPGPTTDKTEKTGLESDSELVPKHLRTRATKAALDNNEF
ncbi:SDR family NAD(P)-dependent oxidoreductase [Adhaeribacter terreus]|uniref:SDR family NAD(P)-dependent oxidoreductase n=1 Tax=Adhaeribacter terreus TaxID=529703 RepID=A0ABW0E642_9BACT